MGSISEDDHSGSSKLKSTTWNNNNINNKSPKNEKPKSMMKSSWEYPYGSYPWPPRYYKCSFCSREFKSSQALGGHMNVHRRDRAREKLRSVDHSSNYEITLSNPNPINPRSSSSSSSSVIPSLPTTSIYSHHYSLVSLSLSSCRSSSSSFLGRALHGSYSNHKGNFVFTEKAEDEGVKLDLELGLTKGAKEDDHELDLELRLGTKLN